ncbi:hypothetical protein [Streptomyces sp. WMMC897]|uniref:hypothetical protein n=1 Tax=Streptomyces sp. WMMC897 TaxID=3014782 RepID=UPI0022B61165|nr:hypothetical protein [Streptomyces sp. WMMC897]MCZ7414019.1 hypothetical protein [Streptomyces sp. WMMC897]
MLLANPGRSVEDQAVYARRGITERALANAASTDGMPMHYLDPALGLETTPGGRWWRRTLGGLRSLGYTYGQLAARVLAVQFHGYHAEAWKPLPITLPSQRHGFRLVRKAIERDAVIVLTRASAQWLVAVPQLADHRHLLRTNSTRNPALSDRNLSHEGWEKVRRALR